MTDPPEFSTIIEALSARAAETPDAMAYAVERESLTYRELLEDVTATASELARVGLAPGDRCAVLLPTSLDFVRVVYGAQMLGAAPVAVDPDLPAEAIMRRLIQVRCHIVAAEAGLAATLRSSVVPGLKVVDVREVCRAGSPERTMPDRIPLPYQPAFLQFTSGAEGDAKAAVIEHRHLMASLRETMNRLADGDILVGWVPLYHDLGLVRFIFTPLYAGLPVFLVRPGMASLRRWLETVARTRATVTAAPDFVYRIAARAIDREGLDLSSLRHATSGGEPVRLSTIKAFEEHFDLRGVLRPAYGLAEATLGVAAVAPGERLRTDEDANVSCGPPVEGTEVRILKEAGVEAQTGTAGEIVVRSPSLFAGYFDDQSATDAVLRDGWLHTGDIGKLDADGHLYVLGRRRAMIKRAGTTIAPRDIEEATDRVNGVRFSAAIGVERGNEGGTEDIVIVAEVRMKTSAESLSRISRAIVSEVQRSAGFSPQELVLVKPRTVPRTRNGKIRYEQLRQLFISGELDGRRLTLGRNRR